MLIYDSVRLCSLAVLTHFRDAFFYPFGSSLFGFCSVLIHICRSVITSLIFVINIVIKSGFIPWYLHRFRRMTQNITVYSRYYHFIFSGIKHLVSALFIVYVVLYIYIHIRWEILGENNQDKKNENIIAPKSNRRHHRSELFWTFQCGVTKNQMQKKEEGGWRYLLFI